MTLCNGEVQVLVDGLDVLVTDKGDFSLPKLDCLYVKVFQLYSQNILVFDIKRT